jgi:hypothetical protein
MQYMQVLKAIYMMFSDTSVPKETTKSNLKGLRDEIDILIETLG